MLVGAPREPASFRDNKGATTNEYFYCFASHRARGKEVSANSLNEADTICELLADEVGVIDVLGMTKMPRNAMLEILNNKKVQKPWFLDTIQSHLGIEFYDSTKVCVQDKKEKKRCKAEFFDPEKPAMSASLIAQKKLERIDFTYADFPKATTPNPLKYPITEDEFTYIRYVAITIMVAVLDEAHIDSTMRTVVGNKLAKLYPYLPDRGGKTFGSTVVRGCDRSFVFSLKWDFQNPRKKMNRVSYPLRLA